MEKGKYYFTNTLGTTDEFGKMLLYLDKDTETIKFEEKRPYKG